MEIQNEQHQYPPGAHFTLSPKEAGRIDCQNICKKSKILLLGAKLELAGVDQHLKTWTLEHLTNQLQFVSLTAQAYQIKKFWLHSCLPSTANKLTLL